MISVRFDLYDTDYNLYICDLNNPIFIECFTTSVRVLETAHYPSTQPLISHLVANPAGGCSTKLAKWIKVAPRNNSCPIVISPVYHIEEGLVLIVIAVLAA